jgi:hypothetical protein
VLFDQHHRGQPQERFRVWEDANNVGAAFDFPVETL